MDVKQMVMSMAAAGAAGVRRLGRRGNRVSPVLDGDWETQLGGRPWTPTSYGEYYPRSAMVYSAIKIRQDAIVRVPLRVLSRAPRGTSAVPVGPDHPVQRLLDSPNRFWTGGDLWRATETYLGLWGSAYWGLERDDRGRVVEIWPLRSDRVRVVPDPESYVKGFVYVGRGQRLVPYVAEDVVWIRYFNPLDEYSGLSPIAPLRLSVDMGMDALRASRNNLSNESAPGLFIETSDAPTESEVAEFYQRWESRFRGVDNVRRPVLLGGGMKAANLGFSPKDMEYLQTLRWSLEDVSRVYGVPKAMLGDMERITFSNFATARRVFWQDVMVPQMTFLRESLEQMLLPNFGDPALSLRFDTSEVEALKESENDKATRRRSVRRRGRDDHQRGAPRHEPAPRGVGRRASAAPAPRGPGAARGKGKKSQGARRDERPYPGHTVRPRRLEDGGGQGRPPGPPDKAPRRDARQDRGAAGPGPAGQGRSPGRQRVPGRRTFQHQQ